MAALAEIHTQQRSSPKIWPVSGEYLFLSICALAHARADQERSLPEPTVKACRASRMADLAAPAEPSQRHERSDFMELLRQAACVEARLLAAPPRSPARAALSARLQAALAVNEPGHKRWQSPAEVTEAEKRTTQQRKAPALQKRQTVALHSAALRAEARAQRLEEARRQADAAAYLRRQQAANRAYGELARQRVRQHLPPATTARLRWQSDTHDAPEEKLTWQPQRWSTSSDESTAWHDDDLSTMPPDNAVENHEDDVPVVDACTEMDDDLPLQPAEELSAPAVEVHDAAVQHSPARSVADVSTWMDTLPAAAQADAAPVGYHALEASPVSEHILRRMRLQRPLHARPAVDLAEPAAAADTQQEDESPLAHEQHTQPSPVGADGTDTRALIRRLLALSAPALRDGATSLPRSALDALGASHASVLPLFEAVNEAMALRLLGCSQLSKEVWLHQLAHVDVADRMEAVVKNLGDRVDRWMACASVSTEEERLEMQHAADLEADERIWDAAVERHYAEILEAAHAA